MDDPGRCGRRDLGLVQKSRSPKEDEDLKQRLERGPYLGVTPNLALGSVSLLIPARIRHPNPLKRLQQIEDGLQHSHHTFT